MAPTPSIDRLTAQLEHVEGALVTAREELRHESAAREEHNRATAAKTAAVRRLARRSERTARRSNRVAAVAVVFGIVGVLVGSIGILSAADSTKISRAVAELVERNEAERQSNRVGACLQSNRQTERTRAAEKSDLRFSLERLIPADRLTPDAKVKLDQFLKDHDAQVDGSYPLRECDPKSIDEFLAADAPVTTSTLEIPVPETETRFSLVLLIFVPVALATALAIWRRWSTDLPDDEDAAP